MRERGPPGSAVGDDRDDQSAAGVPDRLRRDDRERTPLLPGFEVPEPEGRGVSAERHERLAVRQERHHGFAGDRGPVDEPVRAGIVEPNPVVVVVVRTQCRSGFKLRICRANFRAMVTSPTLTACNQIDFFQYNRAPNWES